jgi:hypothetical protein
MSARKLFTTKSNVIEADVKKAVKEIIRELAPQSHIFMPVQTGFGSPDLDLIVSINGFALRIETKVDGKPPTARQIKTIRDLEKAGVPCLLIDQENIEDVCKVVNCLLRGHQGPACLCASQNVNDYIGH